MVHNLEGRVVIKNDDKTVINNLESHLFDVGGLAAHVGASDDLEGVFVSEQGDVIRNECHLILHLYQRVSGSLQNYVTFP